MGRFTWLLFAMLLVAPAAARDIYVSNTAGDDRFTGHQPRGTGGARSGPVRSIAKALRLAHAGDQIILENTGQPYRESITLATSSHSGLTTRQFTLLGNGAILDGSLPVPADAWEHYEGAVFRFSPRCPGAQMLFLAGRPANRVIADPLRDRPPTLEPLQWCEYHGHIFFCVEPTKLPEDYPLTYAALPTGITLFHCRGVTISDLTVQGFRGDGISALNSAYDVELAGVTCRGNARAGVTVGGASLVLLHGCLLGDNFEAQLLTLPYGETHIRSCDILGNTAPAWVDQGGVVLLEGRAIEGGRDEILYKGSDE